MLPAANPLQVRYHQFYRYQKPPEVEPLNDSPCLSRLLPYLYATVGLIGTYCILKVYLMYIKRIETLCCKGLGTITYT